MEGDLSNKHSKGDLGVWLTEKTQILSEKNLLLHFQLILSVNHSVS